MAAGSYAISQGFVEGTIGAAGAILGGILAAWFQSQRTADLARRLRHEERQDEALIRLEERLVHLTHSVSAYLRAPESISEMPGIYAQGVEEALVAAYEAWWQGLGASVFDEGVRETMRDLDLERRIREIQRGTSGEELVALYRRIDGMARAAREAIQGALQLPR